jgi:RNA polymerase sigma-70 factor (ECF subfamily)
VRDDSEHTLMARIAAGDHAACGLMVDRHLGRIVAYARRLLGDQQEAEDVAQKTFVRLWTHAERWEPRNAKVGTWLHRVAHNQCIDHLRKRREVLMDELPDRQDPAAGADQLIHQQDVAAVVEAAVARLPERQRAAILLCHHQELGNIEAAEVLGVTVEALESLLTRGRRKLRELLRERAPELLGDL